MNDMIQVNFDTLPEVTRVYVGADNACRCGCKGVYHEPGSVGFKRALSKARKLGSSDDVNATCANFPYGNNRAITLYFD